MNGPEKEELVRRIALGELTMDDPHVKESLARDPDLAREVEAVMAVQRDLQAAAEFERDVLREAGVLTATAAPPRRIGGRPWLLLVAAAVVFLATWWWWPTGGRRPTDTMLGRGITEVSVRHVGDRWVVRWGGELQGRQYYRVAIRRLDTEEVLVESDRLPVAEWTFTEDNLPPRVTVEVEIGAPGIGRVSGPVRTDVSLR